MNGRQGAVQARRRPQFLEGQIGLLLHQCPELLLLPGDWARLAAGAVMLRSCIANPPPLLQELLDQPQGNPKATCHRFARAFACVIGSQDPFAQVQGNRFHLPSLSQLNTNGYSFI